MPDNWSQEEVEAIVADYFAMLEMDLHGQDYNKAEHNRQLRKIIPHRSRGSIEKKHQNISAVLWHLGYPYIDGYKPLPRYQMLLRSVVEARLNSDITLNQLVAHSVQAQAKTVPPIKSLKTIQVAPPRHKEVKALVQEESRRKTAFIRRNYLEEEARNRSLGRAGEEFILRFERERLYREGRRDLAKKIDHVSHTKGDNFGFDILSFESNGCERFIEVKTTRYGALTRFFASANEVDFSLRENDKYRLYRLFSFDKHPQFFALAGSLRDTCQLKPVNYSAVPN